jgi:hypothetical protein
MCDCEAGPSTLTDWASGDVVCCACGVVIEGHILDEAPEWRSFAADGPAEDRSRVGSAANRWGQAALGTYLDRPCGGGAGGGKRRRRVRDMGADPREESLRLGLHAIDTFVSNFGLSTNGTVACTAKELFSDLHELKPVRSDVRHASAAAAVYFGCKMENVGRELRLVSQVCQVDARALNAATSEFKASLADKPYAARLFVTLQAGKLIDICLDRLRLPPEERRRVWRAAHQLDEALVDLMDSGRKPRTLCSGLLWLALQQENIASVGKREVTEACSVCQQTLDKAVAHMRRMLAAAQAPL